MTKQDYCKYLSENIKVRAGDYWKADHIDMLLTTAAAKGVEPFATWKALPEDAYLAPLYNPEDINLIVVGGEISPLWKVSEYRYTGRASVDKWREIGVKVRNKDGAGVGSVLGDLRGDDLMAVLRRR